MAMVAKAINDSDAFDLEICSTGQHDEMLKQVLALFSLKVNYQLNVLSKSKNLESLYSNLILEFSEVLTKSKPDMLLVHGDTASTFARGF